MAETIKIDGKEYELDKLSDKAKANLISLRYVDKKINEVQQDLAILQTARIAYGNTLHKHLADAAGEADVSID